MSERSACTDHRAAISRVSGVARMREWKSEVRSRLEGLNLTPEREAEIVEELSQHLEDRHQELMSEGLPDAQAFSAAIGELREHELVKELRRNEAVYTEPVPIGSSGGGGFFGAFKQDLKYAVRSLKASPGFTTVAILSLVLGIGANTTIFQLLDAVRMRALPISNPKELAVIKFGQEPHMRGRFNGPFSYSTYALWEQIRAQQQGFSGVFAWGSERFNTAQGGEMKMVRTLWMSGEGFSVLGLQPAIGRLLSPQDDQRHCAAPPIVISHGYWEREFGGAPSVIGRRMTIEGHSFEIVGVTPASFYGLEVGKSFDVAVPLCADPLIQGEYTRLESRQAWWLSIMGRLKPGWTIARASAQLNGISPAVLDATIPPEYDSEAVKNYRSYRFVAEPAAAGLSRLRDAYETPLWLLLGATGLVLLIACANLANLLLARATARTHEIGVRLALGASRKRLVSQLLTESLLLAGAGALLGLFLSGVLSGFLVNMISSDRNPNFLVLNMDWRMFLFTAALTLVTCALFGVAPAFRATNLSPSIVMSASGRGMTANRERFGLRRMLVVSQVALSLVLLVGALLFVRSLTNLMAVDAGFQSSGVLVTNLDYSALKIPKEQRTEFQRQMLDKVRSVPRLEAAMTSIPPMSGSGWSEPIILESGAKGSITPYLSRVTPGYFNLMSMHLLGGRDFSDRDTLSSPTVAVVNQTFVNKELGGASPVGQTFNLNVDKGKPQPTIAIVGVVNDSKYYGLREENRPIAYFSEAQDDDPDAYVSMVVKSDRPLQDVTTAIKQTVGEMNPAIGIEFHVLESQIREGLMTERLMAMLSSFFGLLAAVLATVGLYGVISYMVARRTNEIGIRMALGADKRRILAMIMSEAGILLAIGIAAGAILAVIGGKAAESLLYGLKSNDPVTIAAAVFLLGAVAVLASFMPARRAAGLDPMVALRDE
jgi:putative ABC transport system permease protein